MTEKSYASAPAGIELPPDALFFEAMAEGLSSSSRSNFSDADMLQMAMLGFRMYEQGKYTESKSIFSSLAKLEPTEAYYHAALGAVSLGQEEFEEACGFFDKAIKLNPKFIAPVVNRGEVNLRLGRLKEAAQDFAKALKLDPEFKDPLTQRAKLLAKSTADMAAKAKTKKK
jgi:tetratricopeptide (TPR) repeat protein